MVSLLLLTVYVVGVYDVAMRGVTVGTVVYVVVCVDGGVGCVGVVFGGVRLCCRGRCSRGVLMVVLVIVLVLLCVRGMVRL